MKYSRPILFVVTALALATVAESCTADLNDLDECHAIAKALCNQSASCSGWTLDTATCITEVYAQLPGGADAGVLAAQLKGACGLGQNVTATNCINEIKATQCNSSTSSGSCGSAIYIPVQIAQHIGGVPGDGGGGGSTFDSPLAADAPGLGGSSCSYMVTNSYCGKLTGCGTYPVNCGSYSCTVNAECSGGSCPCDTGYAPICCNGSACQTNGCSDCGTSGTSVQVGCYQWAQQCSDSVSENTGTCYCSNGKSIPFTCGTSGTCQTLCEKG
jgi:hypothetical protein